MTSWIKSIATRKDSQHKAGQDAAKEMYAAGATPLAILKDAIENHNEHPSYAAGMISAAYQMEATEV